jgi:hypothetical protein
MTYCAMSAGAGALGLYHVLQRGTRALFNFTRAYESGCEYTDITADRVIHIATGRSLNRQITEISDHYILFLKINVTWVKCHAL